MKELYRFFILGIILCSSIFTSAQSFTFSAKDTSLPYVRLLFAGDAMQHSTQFIWAWDKEKKDYSYEPNFRYIKKYLDLSDVNIVNFETTLSGKPYSGYPRFTSPEAFLYDLTQAGFNVFALANNHILDGDKKGMLRTLKYFEGIPHLGAYRDDQEREKHYPLILYVEDIKIALFNATYGTNGLSPVKPTIVNYIETEQLHNDITESLKDSSIDLRIMYIHWGTEYELRHNAIQQGTAQWLADLGIDLIVGSHPHVTQDYEVITSKDGKQVPVIYSLGNLVSNQRWEHSNGGMMATIDIDKQSKQIIDIAFIPFYVHKGSIPSLNEKRNYYCIPTQDYLQGRLPFTLPNDSIRKDLKNFHHNTLLRINQKK